MENSTIYDFFDKIFSEPPQPKNSIRLQLEILNNNNTNKTETELSDIFEILLHMFVYGFKKLALTFNSESINLLKQYYESINIKLDIETAKFDTILFKSSQYLARYCVIDPSSIFSDLNEAIFIMNHNQFNRSRLYQYIAVYQDEYESLIFINFDFIL